MTLYQYCKKYIEFRNMYGFGYTFEGYLNLDYKKVYNEFYNKMSILFHGNPFGSTECQQYINRVHKLILTKIS